MCYIYIVRLGGRTQELRAELIYMVKQENVDDI